MTVHNQGIVFSYEQLYKLKKIINSLKLNELNHILFLTSKNLPKENIWIKKLIENDFKTFEKDSEIRNFWINKRIIRQKKKKSICRKSKFKKFN